MKPSRFGNPLKRRASIYSRLPQIDLIRTAKEMSMLEVSEYSGELARTEKSSNDKTGSYQTTFHDEVQTSEKEREQDQRMAGSEATQGINLDAKTDQVESPDNDIDFEKFAAVFNKLAQIEEPRSVEGLRGIRTRRRSKIRARKQAWTCDSDEECMSESFAFDTSSSSTSTSTLTSNITSDPSTLAFSPKRASTSPVSVRSAHRIEVAARRKEELRADLFCPVIDFGFVSDDEDSEEEEDEETRFRGGIHDDQDLFGLLRRGTLPWLASSIDQVLPSHQLHPVRETLYNHPQVQIQPAQVEIESTPTDALVMATEQLKAMSEVLGHVANKRSYRARRKPTLAVIPEDLVVNHSTDLFSGRIAKRPRTNAFNSHSYF
ncbi:hypothetical protein CROQUDRAFT_109935 [Cronartium quercuum f. sp. fusiforme G11]|uniref:Uncharacterized protein n=1 Tax=Cronartium quercuum f. sp. fusiforme G11 TaxID=708437 RepID=A0A9P6T894_9BASI|nr:hypothetical protein CROQUDRAFT_109935 [Cronartium quercuum f. sp. fusiforme G11]